jgi:hypothetical protein
VSPLDEINRRRRIWAVCGAWALALCLFLPDDMVAPDGVTWESYEGLRLGMTQEEVASVLGGAGEEFDKVKEEGRPDVVSIREDGGAGAPEGQPWVAWDGEDPRKNSRCWKGRHGVIGVRFGDDGRLTDMEFIELAPSFLERVRGWIRAPWGTINQGQYFAFQGFAIAPFKYFENMVVPLER